ncbi:ABC transporter substrate-binding protein [Cohnella abietis]|uniref:Sugar ABC transporter substrate-binding protein n=1 Tax=Cohnella abietis TaxID=2507935 RepID=A0A3T1D0S4_9BACL|nr:ABC transporter substrate-binding protein [Cohnella abietis]BBI31661.1 hypothetical protein KCTCHS21_10600 [Cohnella abietis]
MNLKQTDWEKELDEAPLGMGGFSENIMNKIKERVRMPQARKRKFQPIMAAILAVTLLGSAWLFQDPIKRYFSQDADSASRQAKFTAWDKEDVKLNVQYYDKSSFMRQIGLPFIIKHPKVQFDVPQPPESYDFAEYKKWFLENEPDIVQIPLFLIDDLANEGLIKPLDSWISRDNYSLKQVHEPVIQTIREAGAGTLYGLSPYFETDALYYNKSLFNKLDIQLPTDQMTWKDILQLAARFNGKDSEGKPIYGLTTAWDSRPFDLIQAIGETEDLRMINAANMQATIDSSAWSGVWADVVRGYKEGWISGEARAPASANGDILMTDLYKADPFLSGRAAMAIKPSYYRQDILSAEKEIGFNAQWGIVTQPVSNAHPDQATQFSVSTVYAVNAKSPRAEAAWALLKFMTGPEKAKQDKTDYFSLLSSRLPTSTDSSGQGEDVFYRLKANSSSVLNKAKLTFNPANNELIQRLQLIGNDEFRSVIAGIRTIEEAMQALQSQFSNMTNTALKDASAGKGE